METSKITEHALDSFAFEIAEMINTGVPKKLWDSLLQMSTKKRCIAIRDTHKRDELLSRTLFFAWRALDYDEDTVEELETFAGVAYNAEVAEKWRIFERVRGLQAKAPHPAPETTQ